MFFVHKAKTFARKAASRVIRDKKEHAKIDLLVPWPTPSNLPAFTTLNQNGKAPCVEDYVHYIWKRRDSVAVDDGADHDEVSSFPALIKVADVSRLSDPSITVNDVSEYCNVFEDLAKRFKLLSIDASDSSEPDIISTPDSTSPIDKSWCFKRPDCDLARKPRVARRPGYSAWPLPSSLVSYLETVDYALDRINYEPRPRIQSVKSSNCTITKSRALKRYEELYTPERVHEQQRYCMEDMEKRFQIPPWMPKMSDCPCCW
ncbi:hypothetical protein BDQ17DRAFT_1360070 [Cyathus striatus]|nr:hypothetical protein BDQ17DRAFT_1360070 [Cyathus striatus]